MKKYYTLLFLLVIVLQGCKKDDFPDEFVIFGRWIEVNAGPIPTELDFKYQNYLKVMLNDSSVYDYRYLIDKKNELQIFDLTEYPDGMNTVHKMTYSVKSELLTIEGLYILPQDSISFTTFRRR